MCSDNDKKIDKNTYLGIQCSINEWTSEQKKIVFDILAGIGLDKKENLDKTKTNKSNQYDQNRESEVLNGTE